MCNFLRLLIAVHLLVKANKKRKEFNLKSKVLFPFNGAGLSITYLGIHWDIPIYYTNQQDRKHNFSIKS